MKSSSKPTIGWREWVKLPDLKVARIKAKIDTGARTSALHVYDVERFRRRGSAFVRFKLHPVQRTAVQVISTEAELIDERWIRSSSGHRTLRPVIVTSIELFGLRWEIELTLTSRDEMGFRMLLGREAIRKRMLVDAGRSFLAEKAFSKKKTMKRQ